jgi:hypothetical protein
MWENPYKKVDYCREGSHEVFLGIWRCPSGGGASGWGTRLFWRDKTLTEAKLDKITDILMSNRM